MWKEIFIKNQKISNNEILKILKMNNFKKDFKIIHVVGTNGKGSTASIIAHNLMLSGKKVGLFTSPHITSPNERIKINDTEISDLDFFEIYDPIKTDMSFFTSLYIVAMIYFQRQKCDIVILEAGIGGQHDITSLIKGEYAVLTHIALDHVEILGHTKKEILKDKIKIINDKSKLYYGSALPDKLKNELVGCNELNNCGDDYIERNFSLAKNFLKDVYGIENVVNKSIKGRAEIINVNGHKRIFDVAHNIDGISETLKLLKTRNIYFDKVLLMIKTTKDISELEDLLISKDVYYWQKNSEFHTFKNYKRVDDPKSFIKNNSENILIIGSFQLSEVSYD